MHCVVDLAEFTSERGSVHQMFRQLTAAFFSGVQYMLSGYTVLRHDYYCVYTGTVFYTLICTHSTYIHTYTVLFTSPQKHLQ